MRKNLFILILAAGLTACGGSSGSSSLGGTTLSGNTISTTVDVTNRYVYSLNSEDGTVSGFALPAEEAAGGHDHSHEGHNHKLVLAQDDHDHDHEHEHEHDHEHEEEHTDHEHEHEHGEGAGEFSLTELAGSPFVFPGVQPVDMLVSADGGALYLLGASGQVFPYTVQGGTGQLTPGTPVASFVNQPRFLRLSEDGRALAVVGERTTILTLGEGGAVSTRANASTSDTADWTDLRFDSEHGVAATSTGAAGFSWQPETAFTVQATALPGSIRGQAAYGEAGVFVVNTEDASLSLLEQADDGSLSVLATLALPEELTDPQTLSVSGEELLVGDSDSVVLLHLHDDHFHEEGHVDIDQVPTVLFPVPETTSILVGHAQGEGYHVLEIAETGLVLVEEAGAEQHGVSAFGFAERVERITRTISL